MTRKDYVLIASAIREARVSQDVDRENMAGAIAVKLAEDNPRFDREIFLLACLGSVPETT